MTLHWMRCDPTGNITALVTDPIPPAERTATADCLMAADPAIEQVGFLSSAPSGVRLDMAGGEFCGNATLSAAAICLAAQQRAFGTVSVSVSGVPAPVTVAVRADADGYTGRVAMPLPTGIAAQAFLFDGRTVTLPTVTFPGITHAVVRGELDPAQAERVIAAWAQAIGASAFGLMLLDGDALLPLVYVATAGTRVWEQSCASGSSAVAAWMAHTARADVHKTFDEPGGRLTLDVAYRGGIEAVTLTGAVRWEEKTTIID